MAWILFVVSSLVIVHQGAALTRLADLVSDRLNLGKAWIGTILLGFITSLPEAVTCVSSIVTLDAYDLAVGNLLGSNNFNPLLIVVMDFAYRSGSVTHQIHPHRSHTESVIYVILLTGLVIVDILTRSLWHMGPVSGISILIFFGYFAAMTRLKKLNELEPIEDGDVVAADHPLASLSTRQIWFRLSVASAVIVGAAMVLAFAADKIAEMTGWGGTFVGSILLALVTSLPEMVVTVSAMRMASFDLAVGNILGSNISNLFILVICSFLISSAPMFSLTQSVHALTGGLSIVMVLILLAGIYSKNKLEVFRIGLDSWLMAIVFMTGSYLLFRWS
jgi:cation:H+ antiporter